MRSAVLELAPAFPTVPPQLAPGRMLLQHRTRPLAPLFSLSCLEPGGHSGRTCGAGPEADLRPQDAAGSSAASSSSSHAAVPAACSFLEAFFFAGLALALRLCPAGRGGGRLLADARRRASCGCARPCWSWPPPSPPSPRNLLAPGRRSSSAASALLLHLCPCRCPAATAPWPRGRVGRGSGARIRLGRFPPLSLPFPTCSLRPLRLLAKQCISFRERRMMAVDAATHPPRPSRIDRQHEAPASWHAPPQPSPPPPAPIAPARAAERRPAALDRAGGPPRRPGAGGGVAVAPAWPGC